MDDPLKSPRWNFLSAVNQLFKPQVKKPKKYINPHYEPYKKNRREKGAKDYANDTIKGITPTTPNNGAGADYGADYGGTRKNKRKQQKKYKSYNRKNKNAKNKTNRKSKSKKHNKSKNKRKPKKTQRKY